ncbi:sigma-54 dependent transcriptional regulator [Luminiphilus sp.]|nr:sigma-54 dependent transcriptional regulator [Luminiphilus sp.]MDB2378003.1 sigma-54 dependent transcriptional regulator [Luminiphilus sp.]MDB2440947.1 sigma-54 dependent transcriptional regulator [Luminiphilus sp.]MDB2511808.1 sigma-54 dependent transcriptional regulator [Luminiphilus sp.]
MSQTVLLVDDEPDILQLLEIALARMNLNTLSAATVSEAIKLIDTSDLDLCLTDMRLPDGNGLQLVEYAQQLNRELPVAVITAHGSVEAAIDALKLGAFDFVSKPVALDKLRELVGHALNLKRADIETSTRELIGTSPATQRLRGRIRKVARSQAPIHIHGESGAGKEIVARLVHATSSRHAGPFIAVNCGAIPPELVESELFGHLKGSFTGAMYDKQGLFQAANGGTLLLDEVADLPLATQVKLLRVLQEKAVRPVGSESEISIDVRLMSATHKQLSREVAAGAFRDDLFYRINVIDIAVPALKDRREDIPALAHYLLDKVAAENDAGEKALSDAAVQCLTDANYPGNVRQLENILARAAAMSELTTIEADDLEIDRSASLIPSSNDLVAPESETTDTDFKALTGLVAVDGNLEQYMDKIEREILQNAMTEYRWNKTAAAKGLGVSFRSLRYRLKKLGLDD